MIAAVFSLTLPLFAAASTFSGTINADAGTSAIVIAAPVPAPAPSGGGGGGGSGDSLYPVAPVFGDAPPPAPAPTAPQGTVLGAQTTNVPENSAADQTAPAETPAPRAQPPSSQGNAGGAVAQTRTLQAPVAETPTLVVPDVEPQENIETQAAASGLSDFSWWWLFLLILLALGAGYWAWRKYKEYKERKEPEL